MKWFIVCGFLLLGLANVWAQSVSSNSRGKEFATVDANNVVQNGIIAGPGFLPLVAGNWIDANIGFYKAGRSFTWIGTQFQPPQPYPSWAWAASLQSWIPPTAVPLLTPAMISANQRWEWFEVSRQWAVVQF